VRIADMNWMQVEAYLRGDDRAVVPIGSYHARFGVTLSLLALQHIEAGVAASITAFYPVLAILIAARFHGERLTLRIMTGALVAVAGVVVLFLR